MSSPRAVVVDYVEAKFTYNGGSYRIKFKAGKLGEEEHPGVCGLIVSSAMMRQLKKNNVPGLDEIQRFPDIRSFLTEYSEIILESCELPKTEDQNSGDGLCFEDHRGRWVCLGS